MTATLHTLLSVSLSNAIATTCLALAVIVVTRLFRSPALRHALWLLVLVKFVSPAFVKLPTPDLSFAPATDVAPIPPQDAPESSVNLAARALDDRFAEAVTSSNAAAEGRPALAAAPPENAALWGTAGDEATLSTLPALERGVAWAVPCALTAWAAGAALWFALVAVRLRRLERMLRGGDAAPEELQQAVERVAARCGLRRTPAVRVVDGTITPFVWAMWGRSIMIVPQGLIERLDTDERATLLAHELSHLCRRDHWVRWLELLVVGLYWWHPVAWFARRQLHCAGEQCCDARVVRTFPQQARAYAGALLKTIDYLADARATLPVAGTAFSQVNLLKRRFEMILQGKTFDRLPRTAAVIVMLAAAVVLPVSLGSLWAEEAPTVEEASASDPLDILESLVPEEAPAIREAVKSIAKPPAAVPAAGATKSLDERLDRLERLVESLASELHTKREKVAAPRTEAVELHGTPKVIRLHPELIRGQVRSIIELKEGEGAYARPAANVRGEARVSSAHEEAIPPTVANNSPPSSPEDVMTQDLLRANMPGMQSPNVEKDIKKLKSVMRTVDRQVQLRETNFNRLIAARANVEAVDQAYKRDKVTIDKLLDAQRRAAVAEMDFAQTAIDLASSSFEERNRLLATLRLEIYVSAMNKAMQTWRDVKALHDAGQRGGEAEKEAQAREQYFLFRTTAEEALKEIDEANKVSH